MTFKIELEQAEDGRWIAEVVELPGVMAYGPTLMKSTPGRSLVVTRLSIG
jgi:hypothetical protein